MIHNSVHLTKCLPRAQVEHQPNSVEIKKTTENSSILFLAINHTCHSLPLASFLMDLRKD